jgi:hypothetical protein
MRTWSISLLLSAALALAALAPAGASADTCPPGQEGTPPYCKPVAATLEVKVLKATPGSIQLRVTVNLPGQVKVTGRGVRTKVASVGAGTRKLVVKLSKKAKKRLQEKGEVRLRLTVTFTPSNGASPVSEVVRAKVVKHGGKGGEHHGRHRHGPHSRR